MKLVIVASQNPAKLDAAQRGFRRMFPGENFAFQTVEVPSGVRNQPFSNQETLQGALGRACNARQALSKADYWVGMEGGVEEMSGELAAFAWAVVLSNGQCGKGRSATFFLPLPVTEMMRQGMELGEADDHIFGRTNSNQSGGAIGLLSGEVITRADLIGEAVALALLPFKNPRLYRPGEDRPNP